MGQVTPRRNDRRADLALPISAHPADSRGLQPSYRAQVSPPAEYATLGSVMSVLWRQKSKVVLSILGGLTVSGLLYMTQPKIYRGRTTIEIQMPNGDFLNHRQLNPASEPGAQTIEPYWQTQVRLAQTDALVLQVADQLHLAERREFQEKPPFWQKLIPQRFRPPSAEKPANGSRGPFLAALRERLDGKMLGATQIMELTFESEEPQLAADFVNALAQAYLAEALRRQVEAVNQTGDLLADQIVGARRSLLDAERRLQDYVATSGLLSGGDKDSVAEQRLRQVQVALTSAEDARVTDEARYRTMLAQPSQAASGDTLESDTLRTYRLKMTDLRQQLAQVNEVLQPGHYKVRELRAQLTEVEKAYERERAATIDRLRTQYESSMAREQSLLSEYNNQVGQAAAQMTNAVRYSSLKRDVETQQQVYDNLVQRTKEAGVLSAMRTTNFKVVDVADTPYLPLRPQKSLYGALGLASGCLLGILLAFRSEQHKAAPAPRTSPLPLGLRSLGVMPHFQRSGAMETAELASWTSPESPLARVIEGASHFLFPRGDLPRSVGITSPNNGEGKTTAACNLAIELARSGRSVLLVDADHCTPRLHDLFGISNGMGFCDLVRGGAAANAGLVSAWVTRIPNLAVLPCGEGRLSGTVDFAAAVAALGADFDALIFDLPAVLAADTASRIAACVDSVAIVISSEYTTAQGAELALRKLALERAPIAGALFNRRNVPGIAGHLSAKNTVGDLPAADPYL